ncbi:MAG: LytTR family DNA-binding domain-containing protein [bacterium]
MNSELRVLIADDEPAARRGVRQLLAPHAAFIAVGECRDGAEVLAAIEQHNPDVIFLDIRMPGIDGFEVVKRRTPERMPVVVFLTAYEQFALRGFEAHAFDYLVKPVTEARFATTVKRLLRHFSSNKSQRRSPGIVVTTSRGVSMIDSAEIDWIEAADNYARLWIGGQSVLLRESLQRLEERLAPERFCRAHRQALVRIDAISQLQRTRTGGLNVVLSSGATIPVSRRQRSALTAAVRMAHDT